MIRQMFVGLTTEGCTDIRFLYSIVKRTFNEIALQESQYDIDIYVYKLDTSKVGLSFTDYVVQASRDGVRNFGMMALAIHTDADDNTYEERMGNKIIPAQKELDGLKEDICRVLTPVIPVRMTEAWMLADKQLLKDEIGTTKSDDELGINHDPESMSDPKQVVKEAIRIAESGTSKRRHKLHISELYSIIGDKLRISELMRLKSYRSFQEAVRDTYRKYNYIL